MSQVLLLLQPTSCSDQLLTCRQDVVGANTGEVSERSIRHMRLHDPHAGRIRR